MIPSEQAHTTHSYGPCWCGDDATTGGHQHASIHSITLPRDEALNAILKEVKVIREIIEKTAARRSGRPIQ